MIKEDIIQGLVDFVNDIKPFHTKIIEVLVDYVHEEAMKVKTTEQHNFDLFAEYGTQQYGCMEAGFGVLPWGEEFTKKLIPSLGGKIVTVNNPIQQFSIKGVVNDSLIISGNYISVFQPDTLFNIVNSTRNNGKWRVISSSYNSSLNETNIFCEFFSNTVELRLLTAWSNLKILQGFVWVDITKTNDFEKVKIFINGMWIPFKKLYTNPVTDPEFIFSTTQPFTTHVGSYWLNTTNNKLYQLTTSLSWNPVDHNKYFVGSYLEHLRFRRNYLILSGDISSHVFPNSIIRIQNSPYHNGEWLVRNLCGDGFLTELSVQHVTNLTPDGKIYTSLTELQPTDAWPIGLYWCNTETEQIKIWNGTLWETPTDFFVFSSSAPINPNNGDLWFNLNNYTLNKRVINSWETIASTQVIIGSLPSNISNGPYFGAVQYVIDDETINFEIKQVKKLSHQMITNPDSENLTSCDSSPEIYDQTLSTTVFVVNGMQLTTFNNQERIIIKNSTGNDGVWKINQIAYDNITDTTELFCSFESVLPILEESSPSQFLLGEWDSTIGFGAFYNLKALLTTGRVFINSISNYDFPYQCNDPTSAIIFTRISENIKTEIEFLQKPIESKIVNIVPTTETLRGYFVIEFETENHVKNELQYFASKSSFTIQNSGNNNGLWTIDYTEYDYSTRKLKIFPVERIPRVVLNNDLTATEILLPYGEILIDVLPFTEKIKGKIIENTVPRGWGHYFYSCPTSLIEEIEDVDNVTQKIVVNGDVRRFYPQGTMVTIQHAKRKISNFPFVESVNSGRWRWRVLQTVYESSGSNKGQTHIYLDKINPLVQGNFIHKGYVSGLPTWVEGWGWDQTGWEENINTQIQEITYGWDHMGWSEGWNLLPVDTEENFSIGIVDTLITLASDLDFTVISSNDMFMLQRGSYDYVFFDTGEFESTLQQILFSIRFSSDF